MKRKIISILVVIALLAGSTVGTWIKFKDELEEARTQLNNLVTEKATLEKQIDSLSFQNRYLEKRTQTVNKEVSEKSKEIDELKLQLSRKLFEQWVKGKNNFESMSELHAFLARVEVNKIRYQTPEFDCEDQAFMLMREGAHEGYAVYPVLIFAFSGNKLTSKHLTTFVLVHTAFLDFGKCWVFVVIEPATLEVQIVGRADDKSTWLEKWIEFLP